jgi:hypothetical protein
VLPEKGVGHPERHGEDCQHLQREEMGGENKQG